MKPLVGISCCNKIFGPDGLPNHAASDYCVRAVSQLADALPVLLPAIGDIAHVDALLDRLDGILLTGSRSNVSPCRYGAAAPASGLLEDPARDATTLPLIRGAIARHMPVLAICRGLQELNVALGGTLHQCLREVPGRIDHGAALDHPFADRIGKAHDARLTAGGVLHRAAGTRDIAVNSLHQQGINQLAFGLRIEAVAPDGTIEAVSLANSAGFALGVQWHPEFDFATDPVSAGIFTAFGHALQAQRMAQVLAAD